jgi:hypothetical protein
VGGATVVKLLEEQLALDEREKGQPEKLLQIRDRFAHSNVRTFWQVA